MFGQKLWKASLAKSRAGALHDRKHSKHDFASCHRTHHAYADGRCLVLLPSVQCWRPHLSPGPRPVFRCDFDRETVGKSSQLFDLRVISSSSTTTLLSFYLAEIGCFWEQGDWLSHATMATTMVFTLAFTQPAIMLFSYATMKLRALTAPDLPPTVESRPHLKCVGFVDGDSVDLNLFWRAFSRSIVFD